MKTSHAIGMVVAAVLITAAIQESRIAALRSQITKSNANEISAPAKSPAAHADATANQNEPTSPFRTKSEREPLPVPLAKDADPKSDDDSFTSTARKMWDNPAGKAMMNQGVKIAVAMMYQDFIDTMNLNKEETDYFKNLLGKEMADQQEIGMKMLGAKPDERKQLIEEQTKRSSDTENEIRKFLNNDEDFEKYTAFKNKLPERQQLDGIRATMSNKGLTLDTEKETSLVDAMYRARTTAKAPDLSGPTAMEEIAKGNMVEIFEKTWASQQEALQTEVSKVLNQNEMAAFLEYQKQTKEMQLMGLKMAEKMQKDGSN